MFHYIIGYDVPSEVKQRIKDLVQITFIASNKQIRLTIEPKGQKSTVSIDTEWKIKNLSSVKQIYTPQLIVLASDRPLFLSHSVISENVNYSLDHKTAFAHVKKNISDGTFEFNGKTFSLEPASIVGEYTIKWEYKVTQPKEHYHVDGFGTPTIGASVTVSHPPSLEVAVIGDFKRVGNQWSTDKMFVRGEFITIQWLSKPSNGRDS